MPIRTRLVLALVLALALVGAMYAAHKTYGVAFGRSRDLAYLIALDGKVAKKLSTAELAAVAEASDGWLAIVKMLAVLAAAALIATEARESARKTERGKPELASTDRVVLFAAVSLIFAVLILGTNYAACIWAAKAQNPKLTDWFPTPNPVYLVDGLSAALAFTLVRIPLWNLAASAEEARELFAWWRRQLGEWIIGKGVIEQEKEQLRWDLIDANRREIESCMRQAVDDYKRRHPPCPNPAAHRAPPPTAEPPTPTPKFKKRDLLST